MRVQRAWEVLSATGRGLSEWHRQTRPPLLPPGASVRLVVEPDNIQAARAYRVTISRKCWNAAHSTSVAASWPKASSEAPSGRALGAAQLAGYLGGEISLEAAVADSLGATRQFAKRQRTWFRNRMADWPRIDPASPLTKLAEIVNANHFS